MRVAVDTALDVDTWLQERPYGNTPRLHIFARLNSLLRHLQRQGHKKVIIVAHSQGTVVACDYLRYMAFHGGQLPQVTFFSLGSPLRQLYLTRFPFLYGWVAQPTGPTLQHSGIDRWLNVFGSGDYVGRFLWFEGNDPLRWSLQPSNPVLKSGDTHEFCAGAVAHTHYFDAKAVCIGQSLDELIWTA
jgi:hypothetical protein